MGRSSDSGGMQKILVVDVPKVVLQTTGKGTRDPAARARPAGRSWPVLERREEDLDGLALVSDLKRIEGRDDGEGGKRVTGWVR
jgi:hypothetical protein